VVRALVKVARETGAHLLFGAGGRDKSSSRIAPREHANSAFLVSPFGAILGRYDKMRLLPFNEYIPLRQWVRWPSWITSEFPDAIPGVTRTLFTVGRTRFGVLICWENLFADDFRSWVAGGADFMVSLSNESFTPSATAHRQLFAINVMRAIENHVPVLRATTTGFSALIAADGRILGRVEDGTRAQLSGEIPVTRSGTLYTQLGNWLVYTLAALLLATLVADLLRGHRGPGRTRT
jgi:apolipoprotein N-acyltransferase